MRAGESARRREPGAGWRRLWVCVLVLMGLPGCSMFGTFSVFQPVEPATAYRPEAEAVVRDAPPGVRLAVEHLRRGSRGGSFVLRVENQSEDRVLALDWSRIGYRLSSGQRRRPMSDSDFLKMGSEFGFAAYGWNSEAMRSRWADAYAVPGEIYRLEPGKSLTLLMHYGAGELETRLTVSLEEALWWEGPDGHRQPISSPPPQVLVVLPPLVEPKESFWPDWFQVGFFVTNSG